MINYFAYGSNLHPMRLLERVPSAKFVGTVEIKKYRLTFHKESTDKSSKCNMFETGSDSDSVFGVIYTLNPAHKADLDYFEGLGKGYIDNQITLIHENRDYCCFTYLAQQSHITDVLKPYHWYKRLVVLGAQYLGFPDWYIAAIEAVESIQDPKERRRKEKEELIERIIRYR